MKRLTDRGKLLIAAGTVAVAAVSGSVAAQPSDVSGTVIFEGGGAIPKGQIEISLENTAVEDNARGMAATASMASDGGAKMVKFSLPVAAAGAPTQQIVARLEREDGWLLARGSAQIEPGAPVEITLFTVMY